MLSIKNTLSAFDSADSPVSGTNYNAGDIIGSATIVFKLTMEPIKNDTNLVNGTTYYYKIFSFDEVPNYSSGVEGSVIPADVTSPDNPSSFTANAGDGQVTLSWVNPSGDFSEVMLLRKTGSYPSGYNDSSATVIYTGTAQSYDDTDLTNGETCYYKIYAYDEVPNYSSGSQANATPQSLTDGSSSSGGGGGGGGCFIATACFGSPLAEEVVVLSRFRDEYLLANSLGRRFVSVYYKYGPKAADYIKDKEVVKRITRYILKPVALIVKGKFYTKTIDKQLLGDYN